MYSAVESPSIQTQFAPLPVNRFMENSYPVTYCPNIGISNSSHTEGEAELSSVVREHWTVTHKNPDKTPLTCEIFLLKDEGLNISQS